MSDISNQFVKDTFNYVLQSDIMTGFVYRIGGAVPVNPIFSSGATFLSSLRYSNGSEQPGYVLTTDGTGNATWSTPFSGGGITTLNTLTTPTQFFSVGSTGNDFNINSSGSTHTFNIPNASPTSRGLVTTGTQFFSGIKIFNNSISSNTIATTSIFSDIVSANTIYSENIITSALTITDGTQEDGYVLTTNSSGNTQWKPSGMLTGGTLSGNTLILENNSGQTINIIGFSQKFSSNIGDNINTAITITHNFSTRDIQVEVYRNEDPWDTVFCDIQRSTIDSVVLRFANPPTLNEYRVVITT